MVFHYPAPLPEQPDAGSGVRPLMMRSAFAELGWDVVTIAGHSAQRAAAATTLRDEVARGRRIEFCYGESTTVPTSMSDPHHLPRRPFVDARLYRWLKRQGIPSGLFYRDAYWRFPQYRRSVRWPKRVVATVGYRFDLAWYRRHLDVLFLPSLAMADHLPGWHGSPRVAALPPGGVVDARATDRPPTPPGRLDLFYVGSITPPICDVTPLVRAVARVPRAHLTLCCPERERDQLETLRPFLDGVEVVHERGAAVRARTVAADAACLVFPPNEYRAFAMPIKLFEAVAAGTPTITSGGTTAADFVVEHGLGWRVENDDDLVRLLDDLIDDPSRIESVRARVLAQRSAHSWVARAATVAERLGVAPPGS